MKPKNIINSLTIFIIFVVVFIANTNFVFSAPTQKAPAPEYFVINEQAKQCGIYWPGDEFSQNKLPLGWKSYEPKKILILKTSYGTCNGEYINQEQYYQGCAQQIGFKYVDYKKVPYTTNDVSKFNEGGWKCRPESGKNYYQGFLVNETSKELTTLIDFSLGKNNRTAYPTEGQCAITDKNWVSYEYQDNSGIYELKIVTPFGECNNFSDYKACCNQLGLTNVGRNLVANKTDENAKNNNSDKNLDDNLSKSTNENFYLAIVIMPTLVALAVISGLVLVRKYKNKKKLPPSLMGPNNPPKTD